MRNLAEAYVGCGLSAETDAHGVAKTIVLEHSRARLRVIQTATGAKYLSGHSQIPCWSKKDVGESKWIWPTVQETGKTPSEGEKYASWVDHVCGWA